MLRSKALGIRVLISAGRLGRTQNGGLETVWCYQNTNKGQGKARAARGARAQGLESK